MRVLLYRNLDAQVHARRADRRGGRGGDAAQLRPLIEQVRSDVREPPASSAPAPAAENFHAVPLPGLGDSVLGVLLMGSSRRELVELENSLLRTGVIVAAAGILLGSC